jgi:hypothetical protein
MLFLAIFENIFEILGYLYSGSIYSGSIYGGGVREGLEGEDDEVEEGVLGEEVALDGGVKVKGDRKKISRK